MPSVEENDALLKMKRLVGLNYIQQKEWNEAFGFLEISSSNAKRDSLTILLADFAREGQQLPRRSEFLAGLFSTVIPGTGKIYSNRSIDGLFSLLTIGLTGWQAYEGFSKDGSKSVKGWVFGSISGVFYLGNIYGSVVAAQIYNDQQAEKLLDRVRATVNVYFD